MTKGQRFTLDGITYYIDTIGPITTLCRRDDGTFTHVNSDDLSRFLKVIES